jgi:hypothetical protein
MKYLIDRMQFEEPPLVLLIVLLCISGFLCPVHTPDGSPCGLLNHLTALAGVGHSCAGNVVLSLTSNMAITGLGKTCIKVSPVCLFVQY